MKQIKNYFFYIKLKIIESLQKKQGKKLRNKKNRDQN